MRTRVSAERLGANLRHPDIITTSLSLSLPVSLPPAPAVRPCGRVPRRLHGETQHQRQEAPCWIHLLLPLPADKVRWGKTREKSCTPLTQSFLPTLTSKTLNGICQINSVIKRTFFLLLFMAGMFSRWPVTVIWLGLSLSAGIPDNVDKAL